MHFRLVRPMKRKGSTKHQFVQRIPADVKARAAGLKLHIPLGPETIRLTISPSAEAVRLSLRVSEPSQVKVRQAQVVAYLESVWRALRADRPVPLTHRQAVALSRDIYAGWADDARRKTLAVDFLADGSLDPEQWGTHLDADAYDSVMQRIVEPDPLGREPEQWLPALLKPRLLKRGLGEIDEASMRMLVTECVKAFLQAAEHLQRQAGGDYRPDPNADRFPEWTPPTYGSPSPIATPNVSLTGLVEEWWIEAKASGRTPSTYESYKGAASRLSAFLKHDDAATVTPANLVAFKDHRLAQGVSPKTVGDSDIAGLRSVFKWAVTNLKLPFNPAEKVTVTRAKATRNRAKSFTPNEVTALLTQSLNHERGRESTKLFAAKRWVPWLCAYSGARLGEVVQLRKQDVRKEGEAWVFIITPDAGTVKDKEAREVVIHEHLIEQGFTAFVEAASPGHLFLTPREDGEVRGAWRSVKNRLREFAREVVTDTNVAPNHGWRHLFKTIGREAGIADSVLDAICGHAAKTVGRSYGGVTLRAQQEAMAKFPRFEV